MLFVLISELERLKALSNEIKNPSKWAWIGAGPCL